jgi:hypothetical protein
VTSNEKVDDLTNSESFEPSSLNVTNRFGTHYLYVHLIMK